MEHKESKPLPSELQAEVKFPQRICENCDQEYEKHHHSRGDAFCYIMGDELFRYIHPSATMEAMDNIYPFSELFERSKNDRAIIVGSEVREVIGAYRRCLTELGKAELKLSQLAAKPSEPTEGEPETVDDFEHDRDCPCFDENHSRDCRNCECDKTPCDVPPAGWTCSRRKGHEGPCAASRTELPESTTAHDWLGVEEVNEWMVASCSCGWEFRDRNFGSHLDSFVTHWGDHIRNAAKAEKVEESSVEWPTSVVSDEELEDYRFKHSTYGRMTSLFSELQAYRELKKRSVGEVK